MLHPYGKVHELFFHFDHKKTYPYQVSSSGMAGKLGGADLARTQVVQFTQRNLIPPIGFTNASLPGEVRGMTGCAATKSPIKVPLCADLVDHDRGFTVAGGDHDGYQLFILREHKHDHLA